MEKNFYLILYQNEPPTTHAQQKGNELPAYRINCLLYYSWIGYMDCEKLKYKVMNDFYESLQHQSIMNALIQKEEMNLFSMLNPKVSIDGNQYCVLYGPNIQEGIVGFGNTIMLAIYDFNKSFYEPIKLK